MKPTRHTAPLICLIGYRGSGKTTIAQLLGDRLGWPWLDADVELERRAGMSIKEIFEREGEAGFRDREEAIVRELTARERVVLALGGGAVLRESNREAIGRGRVVWLQADPETLWQRMAGDPATALRRPNLTGGGRREIEELLAVRTPLYQRCADHAITTAGRSPEQIVAEIVSLLESREEPV
jgi:shikimate kinase